MGIRFYCPNGHKLNVKAFLAGKRGICPHCDARFDIPHESQISEDAPKIQAGSCRGPASFRGHSRWCRDGTTGSTRPSGCSADGGNRL